MSLPRAFHKFWASEQGGTRLESAALMAVVGIATATSTYFGTAMLNDQFDRILMGLKRTRL